MKKLIVALLLIFGAAAVAAADTVYMRDGRVVRGTVLGFIDGRFVVRVDSTQRGGQGAGAAGGGGDIEYFDPLDVQRVEIEGRSLDEARFQTHAVKVTLGPDWIDSGVFVRRGQRVKVMATGVIEAGRRRITPAGLSQTDPDAPLPNAPAGELIGSIGNDPSAPILELGASREFVADNDGDLFLTANRGSFADTRGAYDVQILTERQPPAGATNGQPPNSVFGAPPRPPRVVNITVPGNSQGTDTGVDLRTGDQVTVTATGTVIAGQRAGSVSPDGGPVGFGSLIGTYPVPNAGVGALIGYIRSPNGQTTAPFFIGSQQTFSAPVDGRLILLINDDNYSDNSGSFSAKITY